MLNGHSGLGRFVRNVPMPWSLISRQEDLTHEEKRVYTNRTAYRAARAALKGQDPTRGAQYFYNPRTAKHQWWFKTREVTVKISNHIFAR